MPLTPHGVGKCFVRNVLKLHAKECHLKTLLRWNICTHLINELSLLIVNTVNGITVRYLNGTSPILILTNDCRKTLCVFYLSQLLSNQWFLSWKLETRDPGTASFADHSRWSENLYFFGPGPATILHVVTESVSDLRFYGLVKSTMYASVHWKRTK